MRKNVENGLMTLISREFGAAVERINQQFQAENKRPLETKDVAAAIGVANAGKSTEKQRGSRYVLKGITRGTVDHEVSLGDKKYITKPHEAWVSVSLNPLRDDSAAELEALKAKLAAAGIDVNDLD